VRFVPFVAHSYRSAIIGFTLVARRAGIELHRDELMADWTLAVSGQPVLKSIHLDEDDLLNDKSNQCKGERWLHSGFKIQRWQCERFDVKPYLKYEVFADLKDLDYFKTPQSFTAAARRRVMSTFLERFDLVEASSLNGRREAKDQSCQNWTSNVNPRTLNQSRFGVPEKYFRE
jgi:hypothetical protein